MRGFLRLVVVLGVVSAVAGWFLSAPRPIDPARFDGLTGTAQRGALIFNAAGCRGCHVAPGDTDEGPAVLAGGYHIKSPFGTFIAPNISPSSNGIGDWSVADLGNALMAGVSPDGQHLYPALPYTTYIHIEPQDVVDLKAYLDTLPASDVANQAHDIGFPFTIRRGLGIWKQMNLNPDRVLAGADSAELERGRYLVEALGHCGECHTLRNAMGGLDRSQWLMGAPNPSGKGNIPAIHPSQLSWSEEDIAYYLETGFTPDYDSAGGDMVEVIRGISQLPSSDRAAIAAYLKALP